MMCLNLLLFQSILAYIIYKDFCNCIPTGHRAHEVDVVKVLNFPRGQFVHAVAPAELNLPGGHAPLQDDEVRPLELP